VAFYFGYGNNPVVGDWDGDVKDSVGIFVNGTWALRNSNSGGGADLVVNYGYGTNPVVGVWNTPGMPLLAEGGRGVRYQATLGAAELDAGVKGAMARLQAAGVVFEQLGRLEQVQFTLADLPDAYLGLAFAGDNRVTIDTDAAGYGWFVDSTPLSDEEFLLFDDKGALEAAPASEAQGKMDLLSSSLTNWVNPWTGRFGRRHAPRQRHGCHACSR